MNAGASRGIMMTAAEYRDLARSAHERAGATSHPGLAAELLEHARQWDRLATAADVQEELLLALAMAPSATVDRPAG